jgi:hypothetical protein
MKRKDISKVVSKYLHEGLDISTGGEVAGLVNQQEVNLIDLTAESSDAVEDEESIRQQHGDQVYVKVWLFRNN